MGSVSRLIGAPGEIYALVSNQYVLRSAGARFNEVFVFSNPDLRDFQASWTGKGAALSFNTLLACFTGCDSGNSFEPLGAPSPRGLCTASDQLAVMSRASDGGTTVFAQDGGAWDFFGSAPLRSPLACTRSNESVFFVTQGQVTVTNANGTFTTEVPDTTALGRQSALEPWALITTDGTQVFAASVRGAVARRSAAGAWSVSSALTGEITGLTTDPAGDLWVLGTGLGLAHFTGGQWVASAGPPLLVSFTSIALEGAHVYVGGADAAGVARVFRRLR